MKKTLRPFSLIVIAFVLILALAGCVPQFDEGLVVGDSYRLASGETLNSDLTVIGGNAVLEEDSTVNGDVAVLGGNVDISGEIEGDVSVMGGNVSLSSSAVVHGGVSSLGGNVQRSPGSRVEGRETTGGPGRIPTMRTPGMQVNFDPITGPLMAIFQALALAALALLVSLFALRQMDLVGSTAVTQPIITGGVGLLTLIVAPAILIIMAITIILIPVSLLGILLLGIALLFGWISLGLVVGRQLSIWLKQSWSDPVSAGVGALVLSLVSSLMGVIACLGWMVNLLIGMVGLGAVLLSRFGTHAYTPAPAPRAYTPPPAVIETPSGARIYDTNEPAQSAYPPIYGEEPAEDHPQARPPHEDDRPL